MPSKHCLGKEHEVINLLKCQCHNVSMAFPEKDLFQKISLEVHDRQRVAILGRNGSGKTTLLKILLGEVMPIEGVASIPASYGYMPQGTSPSEDTLQELLCDANSYSKEVRRLLEAFHLTELLQKPLKELSGGEKTKVAFLKAIRNDPAFLILDEPTNYLDVESIKVMEAYLQSYSGAVLMISHDRSFLDTQVEAIYHLSEGTLKKYTGNYTAFKKKRQDELKKQQEDYMTYVKKRNALEETAQGIAQQANKYEGLSQNDYLKGRSKKLQAKAKAMKKRVAMMAVKERPPYEREVHLTFEKAPDKTPGVLLRGEALGKSYDRLLFQDLHLQVQEKDKIALLGANGAGKTTLMRLLLGEIPHEGQVHRSPSVKMAYLSQALTGLQEDMTPLTFLQDTQKEEGALRTLLGHLKIHGEKVFQPLQTFSYGEKLRVLLAKVLLSPCHLLILDEPTNFLDVETKEVFEEALQAYEGALILITHDRTFLSKVATKIWHLQEQKLTVYDGSFEAYEARKAAPEKNKDEILLLKVRQAALSQKLLTASKDQVPSLEADFFALAKEIHALEKGTP